MLGFLHSYFSAFSFDAILGGWKQNRPNYMYRDVLDKNSSPSKLRKRAKGEVDGKKNERERGHGRGVEQRQGIRVKILMTKEEAKRLLSKCKEGGKLEFKDVARELIQIPANRVSIVSSSSSSSDSGLESITEEI